MQRIISRAFLFNCLFVFCLLCSAKSFALPEIDRVANGDVTITQSVSGNEGVIQNSLIVTQASDKAIVNWSSFNVDAQEAVNFQQPTNGICLNRIDAANGMSFIEGSLTANGTILLINQAGILFGNDAQVNVGNLVASTIDMADKNFLDGQYVYDQPSNLAGSIINRGVIQVADNGLVAFLGASVSDEGVIEANMGNVVLASGNSFVLDFFGNQILNFGVTSLATAPGVDETGQALSIGVDVSGRIINPGGRVYLTARAAQDVFDSLINTSGIIQAKSISQANGVIFIKGDEGGKVKITGTLDVGGMAEDSTAGTILVFGEEIVIDDEASLNAGAGRGQGRVMIGWPEGLPTAGLTPIFTKNVFVGSDVTVNLSAYSKGNSGNMIVWANDDVTFLGDVSARGGPAGGSGGNILIHSKGTLGAMSDNPQSDLSNFDVSATNSQYGSVLFSKDPEIISVLSKVFAYYNP